MSTMKWLRTRTLPSTRLASHEQPKTPKTLTLSLATSTISISGKVIRRAAASPSWALGWDPASMARLRWVPQGAWNPTGWRVRRPGSHPPDNESEGSPPTSQQVVRVHQEPTGARSCSEYARRSSTRVVDIYKSLRNQGIKGEMKTGAGRICML